MHTTHKNLLVAFVLTASLVPLSAHAQSRKSLPLKSFGATAGLHVGNVELSGDGAEFVDTGSLIGFTIGGFAVFETGSPIDVVAQVQYIQKGAHVEPDIIFPDFDVTASYLEIPVLARFDIPIKGTVRPYIYAGGTMAFLLSATSVIDDTATDVTEDYSTLDLSAAFGAGVEVAAKGPARLLVDLRYTYGLLNVNANPDGLDTAHRGISLLVGVSL